MPRIFVEFESIEEYNEVMALKDLASLSETRLVHRETGEETNYEDVLPEQLDIEDAIEKAEREVEARKEDPETTFDDVKKAITKLSGAKGIDAVKELFVKFEVKKANDLSEDQYVFFVEACEDEVK